MSEPFLSEIKIVSFNFPPKGWALATGNSCLSIKTKHCSHSLAQRTGATGKQISRFRIFAVESQFIWEATLSERQRGRPL